MTNAKIVLDKDCNLLRNSGIFWRKNRMKLIDGSKIRLVVLAFVFVSLACASPAVADPSFQGLGGFSSIPYGVSADGLVVVGVCAEGAFRWTPGGGMVGLGDLPGGDLSMAAGVSGDGSVVVGVSYCYSGITAPARAFCWTSSTGMVGMGTLPIFPPGMPGSSWAIGASADGSVIVGRSDATSGRQAFRWTSGGGMVGLGDLPGGDFYSRATGVSADGSVIVGWSSSTSGPQHAFRWTETSGMVGLGDLPGGPFYSLAGGVSADGSVVVGESKSISWHRAFLWDQTNGMRNLKDVLVNDYGLDLTGWVLDSAICVSADGLTIVGRGTRLPGLHFEGWIAVLGTAVIPPPAIETTIDIDPDTLNLQSKGEWITCYIWLSEGYDVADIDVGSILLEYLLEVQHSDVQDDVLMVKFDRQDVIAYIELVLEIELPADVTLMVTGELTDGTPFEGSDTIRIIDEGGEE